MYAFWFFLEEFVRFAFGLILTALTAFTMWNEQAIATQLPPLPNGNHSTASQPAHPVNQAATLPNHGTIAPPSPTAPATKSFAEWKAEKVTRAKKQLQSSRDHLLTLSQKKNAPSAEIKQVIDQIAQDEWSVEIAEDLTSTDYLVLYLSNNSSPEKFKEAASKLSAEETAIVLEAYLNAVAQPYDKKKTKLPRHSDQTL
jgi:hypothetical protein